MNNNALGKLKKPMTADQIKCAVTLLSKTVPSLQAHQIDLSGAVTVEVLHVSSHKDTK